MSLPKGKLSISEVAYWREEAQSCEKRQDHDLKKRNNYPFLINYYEGIEKINATYPYVAAAEVYSIINEYFPNTNAIISEIIYQNPDITAEARKPAAEVNERLMASSLRYAFNKVDALIENKVALFDMIYAGYCAVDVDHIRESEPLIMLPGEEVPGQEKRSLMGKVADKTKEIMGVKEAEEKAEEQMATQEEKYAIPEKTMIRRYNPMNVPLDWKAERMKDRRYNLKKIWYSKAEFDARYPDFKDKVFPMDDQKFEFSMMKSHMHAKKILVYDFQIKHKNNKYWNLSITPQFAERELEYSVRPYPTNGFNMKIGTLHKYGKLYPTSFAQINKKVQDEMNEYVRFMMRVAERNIPKFVTDKNKVKAGGIEALRSIEVNDIVEIDGNTAGAVTPLAPTALSPENKELIGIFDKQKQKTWAVSDSRLAGKSDTEFATELEIQEAGFQASKGDLQEGLRDLIEQELETLKDIVVVFWDGEFFFKVTGGPKPEWYVPKVVDNPLKPGETMVENALTDVLTNDYWVKVDITSALRPNKERRKKEIVEFLTWLTGPVMGQYLQSQGMTVNIDEVKKVAQQFGFNSETLLVKSPVVAPPVEGAPVVPGAV